MTLSFICYMEGSVLYDRKYRDFVTDQRQSNLAACLPGKIHRLDWRRGVEKEEALKVLDNSRYLVLPVPVTKIERNHDVNLILKEELTGKKNGTGYCLEGFLDRSGDSAVRMREQNIMI